MPTVEGRASNLIASDKESGKASMAPRTRK